MKYVGIEGLNPSSSAALFFRIKKYKVRKIKKIMIVTSNTATTNQPTKSVPTTDSVMASTMSVDEYFDELISPFLPTQ